MGSRFVVPLLLLRHVYDAITYARFKIEIGYSFSRLVAVKTVKTSRGFSAILARRTYSVRCLVQYTSPAAVTTVLSNSNPCHCRPASSPSVSAKSHSIFGIRGTNILKCFRKGSDSIKPCNIVKNSSVYLNISTFIWYRGVLQGCYQCIVFVVNIISWNTIALAKQNDGRSCCLNERFKR